MAYVLKRYPRISETFVASELIELERLGERLTVFAVSRPEEPFTHKFVRELRAEVVADAIERLRMDPGLAARLGAGGRRHVERNFSLERSAALLRSMFPKAS